MHLFPLTLLTREKSVFPSRSSPQLPRTQKQNPYVATPLFVSLPPSPPYIHPVDVAAASTTNRNGVGLPSDDQDFQSRSETHIRREQGRDPEAKAPLRPRPTQHLSFGII
ncbi:hypothetical protein RHMOL_Rhmol02G0045300 [Rhododendron molle]|uniref:Uncharacterized protein n=1 Tax=Rhododendron molle TaxID=49168 RepID=A0ACC0PLZ7_RHOML|nr:hypothetical protein RHMOL_Rhmol02G0045300 [Rhododendron molle]